jgi:signal peptidase II
MQAKRRTSLNLAARKRISVCAFAVFLMDNFSKSIALHYLPDHPIRVLGDFLRLDLRFNSGAAFSIGSSKTIFFSGFALVALSFGFYFSRNVTNMSWALALGMAMGGILGNLSDRIFRPPGALQGQVVDWIAIPHWPTFNLADSSIVVAAILIVFLSARNIKPIAPDEPTNTDRTDGSGH